MKAWEKTWAPPDAVVKASYVDQSISSTPLGVNMMLHPNHALSELAVGYAYAAIAKRADSVASSNFKLNAYRNQSEYVELGDHPFLELLDSGLYLHTELFDTLPMTQFDFMWWATEYADVYGAAYGWVQRKRGTPSAIYLLNSQYVVPVQLYRDHYYSYNGIQIPKEDIVIILQHPNFNWPVYSAAGIVSRYANKMLNLNYDLTEFQQNLVQRGGTPAIYLQLPKGVKLDKNKKLELSASWGESWGGSSNAGNMPVVDGGAELKSPAYNPNDLSLDNTRERVKDEILAVFGVSDIILGRGKDMARDRNDAAVDIFLHQTIQPIDNKISASFTRFARREYDKKLKYEGYVVLPEDDESYAQTLATRITNGIITLNEGRESLGYDPIEDDNANKLLVPMDKIPLDMLADVQMAKLQIAMTPSARGNNQEPPPKPAPKPKWIEDAERLQTAFWTEVKSRQHPSPAVIEKKLAANYSHLLASQGIVDKTAVDELVRETMEVYDHSSVESIVESESLGLIEAKSMKNLTPLMYIVRHGTTRLNDDKDVRGWADVPLTDEGKEEAEDTAAQLAQIGIRPKKIITSDLKRTQETADIIAGKLGIDTVKPVADLRTWNMGDWEGQPSDEIEPKAAKLVKHSPDVATPNGETFDNFRKRTLKFLNGEMNAPVAPLLVAHSKTIKLLHAWIANGRPKDFSIKTKKFLKGNKGVTPASAFMVYNKKGKTGIREIVNE